MIEVEWIKRPDPRTGRELWQITSADVASEAVYFELQGFTADERFLIFRSERGGPSNLWRCDLSTGRLAPITDGRAVRCAWPHMHHDGRSALVAEDAAVWLADVETMQFRELYRWRGGLPGQFAGVVAHPDGRTLYVTTHEPDRTHDNPDAIASARRGHAMHIGVVDLRTGALTRAFTIPEGFSHLMPNPVDPRYATIVPNGYRCWNMDIPDERRYRTLELDFVAGTTRPLITPRRYRTVTHESWSPDGQRLFFFDKTWQAWKPVSICSVDRDGGDWRAHFTSYQHCLGHGRCSDDGRYFITDAQENGHSPLIVIDLETGRSEIVCWPDASNDGGHAGSAHVHPSFSPSGRYATYTSDATGRAQVYVVPLDGVLGIG